VAKQRGAPPSRIDPKTYPRWDPVVPRFSYSVVRWAKKWCGWWPRATLSRVGSKTFPKYRLLVIPMLVDPSRDVNRKCGGGAPIQ
jgi:hypothetical protein